jgi:hypothetical protein
MPIIDSAMATVASSGEYVPRDAKTNIQQRVAYNTSLSQTKTNF